MTLRAGQELDQRVDEVIRRQSAVGTVLQLGELPVSDQGRHHDPGKRVLLPTELPLVELQVGGERLLELGEPFALGPHQAHDGIELLDGGEPHVEVAPESLDGIVDAVELLEHLEELLDVLGRAPFHRGDEDVVLRPEVAVEAAGSCGETDGTLDVADRRPVEAAVEEQLERGVQDPLTRVRTSATISW